MSATSLVPKENGKSYNILLAEDKEMGQMMGQTLLESLGCRVAIAKDGMEVIEKARDGNFDLVFMDCDMPLVDGYTATAEIRKNEASKNEASRMPIIALTAKVLKNDRQRCISAGMDDYITKPVRVDAVCDVINRWCANVVERQDEW